MEKQPTPYVVFYSVVPTSKSVEGIFIYFTCQEVEIPVAFLPVNLLNLLKLCALKAKNASSIPALGRALPAGRRVILPISPALVRHVLGPVLYSPVQETRGHSEVSPAKGHKDDWDWIIQPEEKKESPVCVSYRGGSKTDGAGSGSSWLFPARGQNILGAN